MMFQQYNAVADQSLTSSGNPDEWVGLGALWWQAGWWVVGVISRLTQEFGDSAVWVGRLIIKIAIQYSAYSSFWIPTMDVVANDVVQLLRGFSYLFVVCFNFILLPSLNYNAAQIWPDWYLYSFIAIFTLSVTLPPPALLFIFLSLLSKAIIISQRWYSVQMILHIKSCINYQEPHCRTICQHLQSSPHYLSAVEKIGKICSDFYVGEDKVVAGEVEQA